MCGRRFFQRQVDLSIEWRGAFSWFHRWGNRFTPAKIEFVSGPAPDQNRPAPASWDKIIESLFPFKLNQLRF